MDEPELWEYLLPCFPRIYITTQVGMYVHISTLAAGLARIKPNHAENDSSFLLLPKTLTEVCRRTRFRYEEAQSRSSGTLHSPSVTREISPMTGGHQSPFPKPLGVLLTVTNCFLSNSEVSNFWRWATARSAVATSMHAHLRSKGLTDS